MITPDLHMRLLQRVPPGIVADEAYFIYLVDDASNPAPVAK
jgi:hypothetical protein